MAMAMAMATAMEQRSSHSAEGHSTVLHIHPSIEGSSAAPPPPPLLDSVPTMSMERAAEADRWPQSFDSIITTLNLIITLVIGVAGLKYLGSKTGLFDENPVPAYFFLIMTWVLILILVALKAFDPPRDGNWFDTLNRAGLACGFVWIVSSISIFLPHPYSFAPLVFLFVVLVISAWPVLRPIYNWTVDHVKRVFDNIRAKVVTWCDKIANWRATRESCLPR